MTKQEYAADAFPDAPESQAAFCEQFDLGDEIELGDNVCQCELYTIGESRCNCGNARISIEDFKSDGETVFIFSAC